MFTVFDCVFTDKINDFTIPKLSACGHLRLNRQLQSTEAGGFANRPPIVIPGIYLVSLSCAVAEFLEPLLLSSTCIQT